MINLLKALGFISICIVGVIIAIPITCFSAAWLFSDDVMHDMFVDNWQEREDKKENNKEETKK